MGEPVENNLKVVPLDIEIVRDRYAKERGPSMLLEISCSQCKTPIMIYQKDGEGRLLRTYLDRIRYPEKLVEEVSNTNFNNKNAKMNLACPNCHQVIGVPMIYEREKRPAFRMLHGTFSKMKYKR